MSLFGVELDDIFKSRPDRGIMFRDNDLFLDAGRMLPAPETRGKLTKVFVRGDRLVQVFGRGAAAVRRRPRQLHLVPRRHDPVREAHDVGCRSEAHRHGSARSVRLLFGAIQRTARRRATRRTRPITRSGPTCRTYDDLGHKRPNPGRTWPNLRERSAIARWPCSRAKLRRVLSVVGPERGIGAVRQQQRHHVVPAAAPHSMSAV